MGSLGRDAAREAWAEHGGDLDAVPHSPELRAWARAGHALGLLESDRPLTEPEQRVFVHAYRGELHRLAAESDASARAAGNAPSNRTDQLCACPAPTRDQLFHGAVAMSLAAEQELDPVRREALEAVAGWLRGLYIAGGAR